MPPVPASDVTAVADGLLLASFDLALPEAGRAAAFRLHEEVKDEAFAAALGGFRSGTEAILRLSDALADATAELGASRPAALAQVEAEVGRLLARVHDEEGMRTTFALKEELEARAADEAELPPEPRSMPLPTAPAGLTTLKEPRPAASESFADLEDEYLAFFAGQGWASEEARRSALDLARRALRNRARYAAAGSGLGIPWWFVAGLHLLESTFNFSRHLHNGDDLAARTFRVPAGRPRSGRPPFAWEASARDALERRRLAGLKDWSLARALYRWEAYNGFGYRSRRVPTPYLWSLSTIYRAGKFVGDGVFSPTAVSKQLGAAAFLRALMEVGADGVAPRVEMRDEGAGDADGTNGADADAVVARKLPNIDGVVSGNDGFRAFFAERCAGVENFEWHEFMVKGGGHGASGLNTDPPPELWDNVVPLVRVLAAIREEVGRPVVLTSVYRSPAYNKTLKGAAKNSHHMKFHAADFQVPGHGRPSDWHRLVMRLRDGGLFSGGVGRYGTFVHVDTRGVNRDWTG